MYFVIHSKNYWLLWRLTTDLQLAGYRVDTQWNSWKEIDEMPFMMINNPAQNVFTIEFYKWHSDFQENGVYPTCFTITHRNYLKVITYIIDSHEQK